MRTGEKPALKNRTLRACVMDAEHVERKDPAHEKKRSSQNPERFRLV